MPVILKSGVPLKSCLKTSNFNKSQSMELGLVRRDSAGKDIGPGDGKGRYKLAFRDRAQQGSKIADVVWVESFKKYN